MQQNGSLHVHAYFHLFLQNINQDKYLLEVFI